MPKPTWTFLTNHAQVLLCVASNGRITAREIAAEVRITERAVQRLLDDLEETGYLRRHREGRNNHYEVDLSQPLRHPAQRGQPVRDLFDLLLHYYATASELNGNATNGLGLFRATNGAAPDATANMPDMPGDTAHGTQVDAETPPPVSTPDQPISGPDAHA